MVDNLEFFKKLQLKNNVFVYFFSILQFLSIYRFISSRPAHSYSYPNLCEIDCNSNNSNVNFYSNEQQHHRNIDIYKNKNNKIFLQLPPFIDHNYSNNHRDDLCNVTVKTRVSTAYAPSFKEQKFIIKVQKRFF